MTARIEDMTAQDELGVGVDGVDGERPGKATQLIDSTHDVIVRLADPHADPTLTLYAATTFEDLQLAPELLKGVYAMGFQKPSKIQGKALPLLMATPYVRPAGGSCSLTLSLSLSLSLPISLYLSAYPSLLLVLAHHTHTPHTYTHTPTPPLPPLRYRNFIGQSQSGTGKTGAFVLAALSRVEQTVRQPQVIILAPTRELAHQILGVVKQMSQFTAITSTEALKDSVPRGQTIQDHVIVGTPGTVQDLLKRRNIPDAKVAMFIIDEADVMMDRQGMGDQTLRIKRYVQWQVRHRHHRSSSMSFYAIFRQWPVLLIM